MIEIPYQLAQEEYVEPFQAYLETQLNHPLWQLLTLLLLGLTLISIPYYYQVAVLESGLCLIHLFLVGIVFFRHQICTWCMRHGMLLEQPFEDFFDHLIISDDRIVLSGEVQKKHFTFKQVKRVLVLEQGYLWQFVGNYFLWLPYHLFKKPHRLLALRKLLISYGFI